VTTTTAPPPNGETYRLPSTRRAAPLLVAGALLLGLVAGRLVVDGRTLVVSALGLVLLPLFLWRKPQYGPAVVLVAALAIEQFASAVGPRPVTARIPLFQGFGGVHVNAADLLLVLVFAIWVAKRGSGSVAEWPRTTLAKSLYVVFGFVVLGLLVGKMHHGQWRFAFLEARPYVYLATTFTLAYVLLTTRSAVRALLWAFVATAAVKAIQGLQIFLAVRHEAVRPDAVLSHEEAVFFALFLFLTLALWLFEVSGPLRTTATALVPLVIAADLANSRRAAWLVLGTGLITELAVAFAVLPHRRKLIGRLSAVAAVALAFYLPAYWNKSGGLAQPARAIHSEIKPSRRDASSDLYRIQEDANLKVNIRKGRFLGRGFGVPIDYVLPITDISSVDPFIKYIPHNGVLYILMRMGLFGGIAFWSMLGIAIIGACRLARSADRELAMIGALTAALVVAYAFEGATDQGFFFYRIAFVVGTFLGLCEAARRLEARAATPNSAER
jgi:hypothetical protein